MLTVTVFAALSSEISPHLVLLLMLAIMGTVCITLVAWLLRAIQVKNSTGDRLAGVYRELDRTRDELQRSRRIDPVTGLVNGLALGEDLRYAEVRHERTGEPFGFVLLRLGHLEGIRGERGDADAELAQVAGVIRGQLRKQDIVSRWADDEFLLLLPETDRDGAGIVAGKLAEALQGMRSQSGAPDWQITSSAYNGSQPVTECIGQTGASPQSVVLPAAAR